MKLIGLTGTTGSGKGYVSALFAKQGFACVDTDDIVHRLYSENHSCIAQLTAVFGDILAEDGSIDRKKLAPIVFSDPFLLKRLNEIVHRYVKDEVERISAQSEKAGEEYLLLDAPQLYEAGMDSICYRVIAVTAPTELRISRICARDNLSRKAAETRIACQHTDAFFEAHADYVIRNDGTHSVEELVNTIIGELRNDKKETE